MSDYPGKPRKVSEEKTPLLHRCKKQKNRINPCTQYKFNLETKEGRGLAMPYLDISILVSRDKESNMIRLLHHLYSN